MNTNAMRGPLYKAGAVLLFFILLAYLTSASPEGSVLNSVGQIIIGAFRLVQWAFAMAIGLAFSIAFLIGVFLFAVSLVNKETSATMYAQVKTWVADSLQPFFARLHCAPCQSSPNNGTQLTAGPSQEEIRQIIAGEVQKVTNSQQALNDQFAGLTKKIATLEAQSATLASADQLGTIASDVAASGQVLSMVQEKVGGLETALTATTQQIQSLSPEKILGDLPERLGKIEKAVEAQTFDPEPLQASVQALQEDIESLKKKGQPARPKKKS